MQIEHVAGIGLASGRPAEQQRHLAIGDGLLGQVVVENHRGHAVVAEELAHGAAGEGREIVHGAVILEHLDELRDGRALLADGDIDAIELGLLVAPRVDRFLIEDGVEDDGGLAGLAVADDQLALAAADGDERVDGLEPSLHRLIHRLAGNDARRFHVDAALLVALDGALAVDGIAQRIDHAAQQRLAHRHLDDAAGALDDVAFLDVTVVAEDHDADIVDFEVQRHAARAVGELDQFAGLAIVEPVDASDAVADRQHLADLGNFRLLAKILDLLFEDRGDLGGPDIHQPTSFMTCLRLLSLVRSDESTMRLPTLTTRPPRSVASTFWSSWTFLCSAAVSAACSART